MERGWKPGVQSRDNIILGGGGGLIGVAAADHFLQMKACMTAAHSTNVTRRERLRGLPSLLYPFHSMISVLSGRDIGSSST